MGRRPSVEISQDVITKIIREYKMLDYATVPYLAKKYGIGVYVLNRRMKKEGVKFFKSGSQANRIYTLDINYKDKPKAVRYKKKWFNRIKILKAELEKQKYECAICEKIINETNANLDHCHKQGHFRGFLCRTCNLGLGMFKDNTAVLKKAVGYLERRTHRTFLGKLRNSARKRKRGY